MPRQPALLRSRAGAPQVTWKGRLPISRRSPRSKRRPAAVEVAGSRPGRLRFGAARSTSAASRSGLYARVILNAEGRLNLREILVDRSSPKPGEGAPAKAAAAAKPATAPTPSRVDDAAVGAMPGMATQAPDAGSRSRTVGMGPPAAAACPGRNLRVGGVRLVNGNIDFSDSSSSRTTRRTSPA